MTDTQHSKGEAYFARVDLLCAPVRVFDEINADEVKLYPGSYFAAVFNDHGLVVLLKHMDGKEIFWEAQYEYTQEDTLAKEVWIEGESVRTRWFTPEGRVTNEVSHAALRNP